MPCPELFDKQAIEYQKKILDEETLKVSIEAGSTSYWRKYIGKNGISFGIDNFGKSAPYKEIYNYFNLNSSKIVAEIQNKLRK